MRPAPAAIRPRFSWAATWLGAAPDATEPQRLSRAARAALAGLLAAALALRLAAELAFPRLHHPDEVYQYLEQAHRLAFGYGVVPWEYRVGGRSWLIPGLLAGLMKLGALFGGGPDAYLRVVAVALAAASLSLVAVAYLWAHRLAGTRAAIIAGTVAATWYELVYFAPRPLAEILATYPLAVGLYLAATGPRRRGALAAAGALLGLAAALRMQLLPAIAIGLALACAARRPRERAALLLGAAAVVLGAGALDWATWGAPFRSFVTNLRTNLVAGRAALYGVAPLWQYAALYVLAWGGALVPIALLAWAGARRVLVLLAVPLAVLLSHSVIAHKEYRFVFPAVPFLLLAAALGTARLVELLRARGVGPRWAVLAACLGWVGLSATSALATRLAPMWAQGRSEIEAFQALRRDAALCGVGIVGTPWVYTAGYTYLHRDVPLFVAPDATGAVALRDAFDAALTPPGLDLAPLGFAQVRCWPGAFGDGPIYPAICLQVRPGGCAASPERTVNPYLVTTGE
jgi:hypothetical protein